MTESAGPLADVALVAAQLGADAIRTVQRAGDLDISTKANPDDFVTAADHAADAAILRALLSARPGDAVLSEESGRRAGTSGVTWVVDPLDGTMNFVHRRDDYAVSVGAERDGDFVAGALVRPTTGDWIAGGEGVVTARDTVPGVTGTTAMSSAMFSIGLAGGEDLRVRIMEVLTDLLPQVRDFRRTGSSACDLMAVALGQLDVYLGYGVNDWDVAAGVAVVRAAGGVAGWIDTASGVRLIAAGSPAVLDPFVERAAKV